jgi:integrase
MAERDSTVEIPPNNSTRKTARAEVYSLKGEHSMKTKKQARRDKGDGNVYQSTFKRGSEIVLGRWRIRYSWKHKRYNERLPEGLPNTMQAAKRFLKQRSAEQLNGQFSLGAKDLSYENLRDGLLDHYELKRKKTLKIAKDKKTRYISGQSHLDRCFAGKRACDITKKEVDAFALELRRRGASNSTLNSSIGLLRQMFNRAVEDERMSILDVPKIKLFTHDAARKGFLEPRDFPKLLAAMPEDLRPVVTLGFDTGMRLGEVQRLKWGSVDLLAGEVNLSAEETKTNKARTIPLGGLLATFRRLRAAHPKDVYVFGGAKALGNFRKRWNAACVAAGFGRFVCVACEKPITEHDCKSKKRRYEGLTFHDLKRSAVRNLVRAGVPQSVAMEISGHRTRAVFERYNIASTNDLHDAAKRRDDYVERSIVQTPCKVEHDATPSDGDANSLIQ